MQLGSGYLMPFAKNEQRTVNEERRKKGATMRPPPHISIPFDFFVKRGEVRSVRFMPFSELISRLGIECTTSTQNSRNGSAIYFPPLDAKVVDKMWGFFTEMGFNGKIGFWQENGGRYNIFGFFVYCQHHGKMVQHQPKSLFQKQKQEMTAL